MILKPLLIAAMLFDLVGLSALADRFDQAVIRERYDPTRSVVAANLNLALPEITPRPGLRSNPATLNILARQYLLADKDSAKILIKNDYKKRVPIASTTKIMTAIVVLENYKLNDVVTVSTAASNQIGADALLVPGERITVGELLKCLLVKSGNDAAYALAEYANSPGEYGITKFVGMMNERARELGIIDSRYEDPAGLDASGYSTAFDLFLLTSYALDNPTFVQLTATAEVTARSTDGQIWHQLQNSNRLVREYQYPGAIGVKTGYTPEAGHILVSAARRNGHTLIGVVINTLADTPSASADESGKLLDWGFGNIVW
ncbi:MAG: D-alanyl-D-alanine carboxypeptidase family protein [Patescibacteria group bacterium]